MSSKSSMQTIMYLLAFFTIQARADCFSDNYAGICKDDELCRQTCIEEGHKGGYCGPFREIFVCKCKGCVSTSELTSTEPSGLQLIERFRDDFNDQLIDNKKWTVHEFPDSGGLFHYTSDDVYQEGGFMFIRSQRRKYGARNFTAGYVHTNGKFSFLYGEVEWRGKIAGGKGIASHLSIRGPETEEIQVAARGDYENMIWPIVKFKPQLGTSESNDKQIFESNDYVGDFHTYKVIWRPDKVIWLIDGNEVFRVADSEHIPKQKAYLLMTLMVGHEWTGIPDSTTTFPTLMVIDYVTVKQWK